MWCRTLQPSTTQGRRRMNFNRWLFFSFRQEVQTVVKDCPTLPWWGNMLIHSPPYRGYRCSRMYVYHVSYAATIDILLARLYAGNYWTYFKHPVLLDREKILLFLQSFSITACGQQRRKASFFAGTMYSDLCCVSLPHLLWWLRSHLFLFLTWRY